MIRTSCDREADAYHLRFGPQGTLLANTVEVAPGVVIDLDAAE